MTSDALAAGRLVFQRFGALDLLGDEPVGELADERDAEFVASLRRAL